MQENCFEYAKLDNFKTENKLSNYEKQMPNLTGIYSKQKAKKK